MTGKIAAMNHSLTESTLSFKDEKTAGDPRLASQSIRNQNETIYEEEKNEYDLNDFSASLDAEINRKLQSTLAREIKPNQIDESVELALASNLVDLEFGKTKKVSPKDRLLKLETLMMGQHKINDCLRGIIQEQ